MITEILEGHWKEFLGLDEELAEKRYQICKDCPERKEIGHNSPIEFIGDVCGICYCRLNAKLRLPYEKCPLDKWNAE